MRRRQAERTGKIDIELFMLQSAAADASSLPDVQSRVAAPLRRSGAATRAPWRGDGSREGAGWGVSRSWFDRIPADSLRRTPDSTRESSFARQHRTAFSAVAARRCFVHEII